MAKSREKLKASGHGPTSIFMASRNQKRKVFDSHVLTRKPVKLAKDLYKLSGVDCPGKLSLKAG